MGIKPQRVAAAFVSWQSCLGGDNQDGRKLLWWTSLERQEFFKSGMKRGKRTFSRGSVFRGGFGGLAFARKGSKGVTTQGGTGVFQHLLVGETFNF
jgi:hypothetical protein